MKVSIIEERQKIESIQEQIANDEVPTHDSAYSSRQTTASPTPIPQPSPRKVSKIKQERKGFRSMIARSFIKSILSKKCLKTKYIQKIFT